MSNNSEFIPFNSVDEINFHLDVSNNLVARLKRSINRIPETPTENQVELANHITKSLEVLIMGYKNLIITIQEGYCN